MQTNIWNITRNFLFCFMTDTNTQTSPASLADIALVRFAHKLCDISEAVLRSAAGKIVGVEEKQDASPVTAFDRKIENALRKEIRKTYPHHGMIGEEYGAESTDASCQWIIDPIDGTLAYMTHRPIYGTLICFAENGVPRLGIMNQPVLKKRWMGIIGKKSLCNGAVIKTSQNTTLEKALLGTTSPDYFDNEEAAAFNRLKATCRYTVYGGNCYDYAMLAQGAVDVVVEAQLKPYDIAALYPIVIAAGGIMTGWNGEDLDLTQPKLRVVAAANAKLHGRVLEALAYNITP